MVSPVGISLGNVKSDCGSHATMHFVLIIFFGSVKCYFLPFQILVIFLCVTTCRKESLGKTARKLTDGSRETTRTESRH